MHLARNSMLPLRSPLVCSVRFCHRCAGAWEMVCIDFIIISKLHHLNHQLVVETILAYLRIRATGGKNQLSSFTSSAHVELSKSRTRAAHLICWHIRRCHWVLRHAVAGAHLRCRVPLGQRLPQAVDCPSRPRLQLL